MANYPRRVRSSLVVDREATYWQFERVSLVPGMSWHNRHVWRWRVAWLEFID